MKAKFQYSIDCIRKDFKAKYGDKSLSSLVIYYVLDTGIFAAVNYRISQHLYNMGLHSAAKLIMKLTERLAFIAIAPSAKIGEGLSINHGFNVIIGAKASVGCNCLIQQGVTIGGNFHRERYDTDGNLFTQPIIGNNVHLGAGCAILGPVVIGNHVVVGANTIVTDDVPDFCIVASDRKLKVRKIDPENEEQRKRFSTILSDVANPRGDS